MTDPKGKPVRTSGEHPAVVGFRNKLDSIVETTIPAVEEANQRAERAISDVPPSLVPELKPATPPPPNPPSPPARWMLVIEGWGPVDDMKARARQLTLDLGKAGHTDVRMMADPKDPSDDT